MLGLADLLVCPGFLGLLSWGHHLFYVPDSRLQRILTLSLSHDCSFVLELNLLTVAHRCFFCPLLSGGHFAGYIAKGESEVNVFYNQRAFNLIRRVGQTRTRTGVLRHSAESGLLLWTGGSSVLSQGSRGSRSALRRTRSGWGAAPTDGPQKLILSENEIFSAYSKLEPIDRKTYSHIVRKGIEISY